MDRRAFVRAAGALVAGALAGGGCAPEGAGRRRTLRLAQLTDVHVEPGARPEQGFARALRAVHALADRPDLLLNGGDAIFTALSRDADDVARQFRLWREVLADGTDLPLVHCIGNHDVFGWRFRDDARYTADPRYGKRWALDVFELERPYYTADRGGWRFIVLDSTGPSDAFDYTARLDDTQFEWLAGMLAGAPPAVPVCVVSHIPIVSVAATQWFGAAPTAEQRVIIETVLVHRDGGRILELFERHANVRLCLSGHLHMQERVEFRGVTYLGGAAVSGNWWNAAEPAFRGFGPAFQTIDLYDDGTFEHASHAIG